jgi:hypothetical protein
MHQNPRLHGGGIVVAASCTTPCQLTVRGFLTINGRRVRLIPLSRSVDSGRHRFRINLSRRNRALLLRMINAHRSVRASLTISAAEVGAPSESTSGEAQIKLRR